MSDAKKSPKSDGKQIMDVAHPGKSAPSATSKSILVTNRPIMQDPMMVDSNKDDAESAAPDTAPVTPSKIKLHPLTAPTVKIKTDHDEDDDQKAADETDPVPVEPAAEKVAVKINSSSTSTLPSQEAAAPEASKDEKPEETTDEKPEPAPAVVKEDEKKADEPEPEAADESNVASDAEESSDEPKIPDDVEAKEAEKAAKHDADMQAIADSKKYYLPVNSVEKRRTKRVVVLGVLLSVLLALAWADIALDAGLIQIDGIKPVTHFFSN